MTDSLRISELEKKIEYIQNYIQSTQNIEVKYTVGEDGKDPTKDNPEDAGTDLYASEDAVLEFGMPVKIKLSTAFQPPAGVHGLIVDRSSMGNNGIHILGGLIDSPYRGDLEAILVNLKIGSTYNIQKGQKITQIIFINLPNTLLKKESSLNQSSRNTNGFGSSGQW